MMNLSKGGHEGKAPPRGKAGSILPKGTHQNSKNDASKGLTPDGAQKQNTKES